MQITYFKINVKNIFLPPFLHSEQKVHKAFDAILVEFT